MAQVFLAIPTYLDRIENSNLILAVLNATEHHAIAPVTSSTSANCLGFNILWLKALSLRSAGFTHFCMLHSDVVPEHFFVDKMLSVMARTGADVLSAVIPIKDQKGLTSTALDEPVGDWDPRWRKRRLTLREIHELEPTFTHDRLLLNTGLMLVDITKPWVDSIHFHFDDAIIEHRGERVAVASPEDWNFSMDARALGAKLYATREVRVMHAGQAMYSNGFAWGSWHTDRAYESGDHPALTISEPSDTLSRSG